MDHLEYLVILMSSKLKVVGGIAFRKVLRVVTKSFSLLVFLMAIGRQLKSLAPLIIGPFSPLEV